MALQSSRFALALPLMLGALILSDCHCHKDPPLHPTADTCKSGAAACTTALECKDHEDCVSAGGESCCTYVPRTCQAASDCCPGQICKRDHHCFDQRVECPNGDSDCGDPGSDRICLNYTDAQGQSDRVCGYASCDAQTPCAAGLACFQGFCVGAPPCNGHCDDGSICIPQTNQCWAYDSRCNVSCGAGYLPMEKDPGNIWDSCNNKDVACVCNELPALTSNDLGRYSASTALGADTLAVSMYDGQYGDLVVRLFDATGAVTATEYVDGVPANGQVTAGPSGPRHGISDPGPDVGLYTSIAAAADGTLFVSYYDATNGDLKLATRDASGAWTTQTVDATGDVGLFTSLSLDPSGDPVIAYFQRAGATGGTACAAGDPAHPDLTTGVKLAWASSTHPTSATDWTVKFVECAPQPAPSCYGCTSGQICVADSTGVGICANSATGCSTACGSTQVCVSTGGSASCQAPFTDKPLLDIPGGVGVFPSLAFQGSNAVVAYYDHNHKRLRAAMGTTTFSPVTLDDGSVTGSTNTGLYPSVAVEPSGSQRIAIAYHDATNRSLRFYFSAGLGPVTVRADSIVDSGLFPANQDGPSFVGADVNLHFTPDNVLYAAYQNSTANDLSLALHSATGWTVTKVWSTGAVGFFAHIAQLPGSASLMLTHAQLHTKLLQNHPVKDNSLHVESLTP